MNKKMVYGLHLNERAYTKQGWTDTRLNESRLVRLKRFKFLCWSGKKANQEQTNQEAT